MNSTSKKWWIWLILVSVCVAGVGVYLAAVVFKSDPCKTETEEVLIERYPQLKVLREKQQEETEKLLEMQRQQDVIINLKMGNEEISPDQALRFSLNQVDQLADLRKRHRKDFDKMCHEVVSGKQ